MEPNVVQPADRVEELTNKMLINIAGTIASQWEKFTGWLVAGLAAALALIIANLDKTNGMIHAATATTAIKFFVAVLIVHTLQKILAIVVASAAAGMEKPPLKDIAPPLNQVEASMLLDKVEDAYFFPFSCMIHGTLRRVRKGELAHVGTRIVRLALLSSLLALVQVGCSVWIVWVIARGLP